MCLAVICDVLAEPVSADGNSIPSFLKILGELVFLFHLYHTLKKKKLFLNIHVFPIERHYRCP